MDMDIILNQQDLRVFIPVVGCLIGFILFWFTRKSAKIKNRFETKFGEETGQAMFINYTRYWGGISMGILPLLVYLLFFPGTSLFELGLGLRKDKILHMLISIAVLCAIILPVVIKNAKKQDNLANYPQIRVPQWNKKAIGTNLFSWAIYLLGYEMLFRGLLLFPLVEAIGLWPAIAVNIGMYSGTHIPKGLNETIGAIPISIVFCLLSVLTGSIWIAFFVHLSIAWTNTSFSRKYHPEMQDI